MQRDTHDISLFGTEWFVKHQRVLLWLCNTPLISIWFRWVLRINGNRSSVAGREIIKILPNNITWIQGYDPIRPVFQTEFRTNDKFARRLYFAFKPLWYLIHAWDMLIANKYAPELNRGFDTLTQYPGSIGSGNPVDGRLFRLAGGAGEVFGTIHAGAGTNNDAGGSASEFALLRATSTSNQWGILLRSIFCFDTSSLTSAADISAAELSLYVTSKNNVNGSTNIDCVASTPASTSALANSDYAQTGTTVFATIAYASVSTSAYNAFTLDSNGRNNISKTGISKFGFKLAWDTAASFGGAWVSLADTSYLGSYANTSGDTQDPKLVVTYTTTAVKTHDGLARASVKTVQGLAIASVKTTQGLA